MAKFIPHHGPPQNIQGPITLTRFRQLLGGLPEFVDLRFYKDTLVVKKGSWQVEPVNLLASVMAGLKSPVYGNAVFLSPEEIA